MGALPLFEVVPHRLHHGDRRVRRWVELAPQRLVSVRVRVRVRTRVRVRVRVRVS